jgi:hypothetical protein
MSKYILSAAVGLMLASGPALAQDTELKSRWGKADQAGVGSESLNSSKTKHKALQGKTKENGNHGMDPQQDSNQTMQQ